MIETRNQEEVPFSSRIVPSRAALTTHELEWLEPWSKLAELELKFQIVSSSILGTQT